MIVLLSTNEFEYSTDEIVEWLDYYKTDFVRFNGEELEMSKISLSIENDEIEYFLSKKINLYKKLTIFNRRWTRFSFIDKINDGHEPKLVNDIRTFLKLEFSSVSHYLFGILLANENSIWIDRPDSVRLNKLLVLNLAKKYGLQIPKTLVTNRKQDLIGFKNKYGRIITKSIGEIISLTSAKYMFALGTKEVTNDTIKELPLRFYVSLFQELIEKKYEIRVFYLDGQFYSMAIFSQRRQESKIDFRNYNLNDPDRMVPFVLPADIEVKLKKLMNALSLKTGSIDLICDKMNNFIFLEVNPVGQFGMVSKPCNYYLEKIIAEYLIKTDSND